MGTSRRSLAELESQHNMRIVFILTLVCSLYHVVKDWLHQEIHYLIPQQDKDVEAETMMEDVAAPLKTLVDMEKETVMDLVMEEQMMVIKVAEETSSAGATIAKSLVFTSMRRTTVVIFLRLFSQPLELLKSNLECQSSHQQVRDVEVEIMMAKGVVLQRIHAMKEKEIAMDQEMEVLMMVMQDVKETLFVEAIIVFSLVLTFIPKMIVAKDLVE